MSGSAERLADTHNLFIPSPFCFRASVPAPFTSASLPARENNGQQAYAAVILLRLYRAKPDRVTKKARSPIGPLLIHRSFTECLTPLFRQQFFTDDFCTGAEGTQLAPGNLTG